MNECMDNIGLLHSVQQWCVQIIHISRGYSSSFNQTEWKDDLVFHVFSSGMVASNILRTRLPISLFWCLLCIDLRERNLKRERKRERCYTSCVWYWTEDDIATHVLVLFILSNSLHWLNEKETMYIYRPLRHLNRERMICRKPIDPLESWLHWHPLISYE